MSATRDYIASKILGAFGVDVLRLADGLQDKHISSSTLSSHGIDRFVIPHYDELCEGARSTLIHCRVNDTYLISAADRRYSLKIYRVNWRSLESITDELSCIKHLEASGVPVAGPLPRRDGTSITRIPTPEGLRYAVLFQWVRGVAPSFTDDTHSALIGRHLAQLHTASDSMRLGQQRRVDLAALYERPIARIRSHIENDRLLTARFDSLVDRLTHGVRRAAVELTDGGFCHGDAAHVNLTIDDDQVHFFDFEWCGSGLRLYDLATYVWSAHHYGHVRDFHVESLVNSYFAERPRYAASVEFIPLFVILRSLWHTSQCIGLAPQLGINLIGNRFFETAITFCEEFANSHLPAQFRSDRSRNQKASSTCMPIVRGR